MALAIVIVALLLGLIAARVASRANTRRLQRRWATERQEQRELTDWINTMRETK